MFGSIVGGALRGLTLRYLRQKNSLVFLTTVSFLFRIVRKLMPNFQFWDSWGPWTRAEIQRSFREQLADHLPNNQTFSGLEIVEIDPSSGGVSRYFVGHEEIACPTTCIRGADPLASKFSRKMKGSIGAYYWAGATYNITTE